jgi:hypothetical protein
MKTELDHVLALAAAERAAHDSPRWKTDIEGAVDIHSEAVEALYGELYRLLDARGQSGNVVRPFRPPPDMRKVLGAQIIDHLKREIPELVRAAIEDFKPKAVLAPTQEVPPK